ncbi:hypothetical protein ACFSQ7_26900 [Paenibacillus rhizoplanae]
MNQTILIVDDEQEIRELLRLYVEKGRLYRDPGRQWTGSTEAGSGCED